MSRRARPGAGALGRRRSQLIVAPRASASSRSSPASATRRARRPGVVAHGCRRLLVAVVGVADRPSRRPENPIGWIFCGARARLPARDPRRDVGRTRRRPTRLAGVGQAAAWFANWVGRRRRPASRSTCFAAVPGRPAPRRRWRWRWAARSACWSCTRSATLTVPGETRRARRYDNPVGVDGAATRSARSRDRPVRPGAAPRSPSLVVRFRRARGDRAPAAQDARRAVCFVLVAVGASSCSSWRRAAASPGRRRRPVLRSARDCLRRSRCRSASRSSATASTTSTA